MSASEMERRVRVEVATPFDPHPTLSHGERDLLILCHRTSDFFVLTAVKGFTKIEKQGDRNEETRDHYWNNPMSIPFHGNCPTERGQEAIHVSWKG
jgi:hypothetical protein